MVRSKAQFQNTKSVKKKKKNENPYQFKQKYGLYFSLDRNLCKYVTKLLKVAFLCNVRRKYSSVVIFTGI